MRLIAFGDTHGRLIWEEIVKKEIDSDKFIFLGDFFDTHGDETPEQQIENFKKIVEFKKNSMNKVILLLGNHDYHYLDNIYQTYSGYQLHYANQINELLEGALKDNLLQMCFKYDKYVFTHAGITKTWANANNIDLEDIENSINHLFNTKRGVFTFTPGDNMSNTGDDITQTPIWVRLNALALDIIPNVVCVVGHTPQRNIDIVGNIIAIDTLGTSKEYLVIENNIPIVGK